MIRRTTLLELWRTTLLLKLIILLLLATESYPRPVHRAEERQERGVSEVKQTKEVAKPLYKNVPKDDGKADKDDPKVEKKG